MTPDDKALWDEAEGRAESTHPWPRRDAVLSGIIGAVGVFLSLSVFVLLSPLEAYPYPWSMLAVSGVAFVVPYWCTRRRQGAHFDAAERTFEQLKLEEENRAERRVRMDARLQQARTAKSR